MKIDLFIPCFVDQLFPETAKNMVKVLRKAGCEVVYNSNQTCCGQPAYNAGFWKESEAICDKFIEDHNKGMAIVSPSGSCVGFARNGMARLVEGRPIQHEYVKVKDRIFEFSEFLVNILGKVDFGARFEAVVTYHDACGALRECGVKQPPRTLLSRVEGLTLVESKECETCCGFGGTFSTKFEPISVAMAETKVDDAVLTQAEYLVSTDWSCLMHLDGYIQKFNRPIKPIHLADILATGW